MGILNKILFWRKEEEPDFDKIAEKEFSSENMPSSSDSLEKQIFPPEDDLAPAHLAGTANRDLELINSKLDTLKAMLTSMEQRLNNIEHATAAGEKKQRLW